MCSITVAHFYLPYIDKAAKSFLNSLKQDDYVVVADSDTSSPSASLKTFQADELIKLKPGESCSITIPAGKREIGAAGGIQLDLGLYNNIGAASATIHRGNNETESSSGLVRSIYTLEIAGRTTFYDVISITFPYNPKATDPRQEMRSVIVESKDPQTRMSGLIPYRVDPEKHCVTITTDKLTEFVVSTYKSANIHLAKTAALNS